MNQQSLHHLMSRARHSGSKSFSVKKNNDDKKGQFFENLITKFSDSEKKLPSINKNISDSDIFVLDNDLIQFLQCTASALEDCIGY